MIAVDASVIISWLAQERGPEVLRLELIAQRGEGILAPVTLTELLSDPRASSALDPQLVAFPVLEIADGYWERSGALRAKVRKAGRKAALGDVLIAQSCIDADVPLLTRDTDFAAFAKIGGLKLA